MNWLRSPPTQNARPSPLNNQILESSYFFDINESKDSIISKVYGFNFTGSDKEICFIYGVNYLVTIVKLNIFLLKSISDTN